MAKQKAELRVVLTRDDSPELVLTVRVQGYDMYLFNHHQLVGGKTSIHESGVQHGERKFLSIREPDRRGVSLKTLENLHYLSGFAGSRKIGGGIVSALKEDTKQRKTLRISMPSGTWGVDVWAFPPHHTIAREVLLTTRPWPEVPIIGALHADWLSPNVMVTVWGGGPLNAYKVIRYSPAVQGHTPFEIFPESYEGTALYHVAHRKMDPFRQQMREWILTQPEADIEFSDDGDE